MAASLGLLLFAYICLVFQVTYRICMMQCNPMPGPGMYHGDMGDIRFSGSHVENTGSVRERRDGLNTRQIRFEPSYLDFQDQPVGMPRIKTVAIINPNTEQSLQLQSISGSTVHFHASFFQAKIVQPLGNTTFEIVFLARLVGNAENTLFIHTSKGVYPYQVFGSGSPNPYRLRPFLGARVPLNFSFTSLINMHNPFNAPLQVVEMYSSGGDLHLELPSGLEKAPQKHWEIPPYETKALMRVSFVGRTANNHTAFIRIKTSNPSPVTEFLILPVEVEVTSVPGLFASVDLLDFGTLRTMDEPKAVGVYLLNSGSKQAHLSSITVEPSNSAVSVTFSPLILKPGSKYVKVATVTYSAYHVKRTKQTTGKIIIKTTSKTSNRMELPYHANVLLGTIAFSVSKTRFFVGQSPFVPVVRELPITNSFGFTMVIYEAVFPQEVERIFQVVNFTKPAMIPPQTTSTPFYVQFLANSSDLAFSTILRVYTNASIFTIPIHCYNGKVKYIVEGLEEDVVDYGTVGTGENRSKLVKIYNNNPIEVTISKITCNVEFATIKLLDVRPNDSNNVTASPSKSKTESEHGKVSVKPDHAAVFSVDVSVPKKEGSYNGEFEITTDFEVLHVPIYFKAMDGKVFPSPKIINFQPCFPGRIERSSLILTSTFLHPLKLLSVTPEPADPQFSFEENKTELEETNGIMGNVVLDPLQSCKGQCYVGLGSSNLAAKWLETLALPPDVVDVDSQHVDKLQRVFDTLKRTGKNRINTTLVIDTDLAQGIRVIAQATLTWPSLAPDKPIKFPLTHIGNHSIKYFTLENPADLPVVAQVVSLSNYPKPQGLLDVVADRFGADLFDLEQIDDVFSLPDTNDEKSTTNGSLLGVTPAIQGILGVAPASSTYATILQPRSKIQIPVQFSPVDDRTRSSIILIRNNLTVLDAVNVQGQGARGEFMLNSKQPGVHSILLFELRASHLSDCHKPSSRSHSQPPLSVKKILTATNPGQLAIFVSSLSINGHECEGWGFKILNCKSFILNPNTSRKIEIAFTPDFTMSRVTRQLEVKTTFGPIMEFTLVATIPPHILPLCATAMGRSSWEPVLQVLTAVVMVLLFIAVVVAAYSEARSILGISMPTANLLLNCEERGQVFDLKAIAGVKSKSTKEERQINLRKSRRETKDTKTNDRQIGDSTTTSASPSSLPNSINNNVNKTSPTTRQDSKTRSPKASSNSNDSKTNRTCDSIDGSKKQSSSPHEPKLRPERPRSNTDSYKRPIDWNRDYRPAVVEIEELKQSIASVQEMESENSMNFVKDFKDVKSRSKKKSKALNKRDESRSKSKEKNNSRQPADSYEAGCSDDSGNEGYTDKITLDLRMDTPTDHRNTQRTSNDSSSPNQKDSNRGTNDKTKTRKNQVAPSSSEPNSKTKKYDNQSTGKSRSDSTTKNKDRTAALQAEPRDLGNSPHAIAAAVMSHLEKSLQTSTRDNSYEEGEPKRKAFNKVTNCLSDSPPLISPTNLSGSSRSSSYSSIVSDGSSSGSDQGKGSLAKALKQRLKPSKSLPMGDQGAAYDPSDRQAASMGFRPMKHSPYHFSLCSAKKSPWSTSADSALTPGSRSPTIQRSSVQFSTIPSSSLFESTPFNSLSTKSDDPRTSPNTDSPHHPLDLSAFGVSGVSGDNRPGRPSIWSSPQNDDPFDNSQSFFSVPPPQGDETFQGKPVHRPNNWVNFLDNANTSPTAGNFKSVAEIWDSGSTPATDGWAHCSPPYPADPRESEADPVDALFSATPDWSTAVDSQDNATFVAQETWGPAPVTSIWGEQYSIPTSGTTTTSDSLTFPSPQPGVDTAEPESPGGTFDTMSGFSPADIWQQQSWSMSSKE